MPWWGYSLIAMFFNSWYSIVQKWALNLGINKIKLLTYVFISLFFCYLGYNLAVDSSGLFLQLRAAEFYLWGLIAAGLSLGGNVFQLKALEKSPNPGYVQSVVVINVLVVLFFSVAFFHSPITWLKLLGILVVLIGLYVLLIDKSKGENTSGWQLPAAGAMLFYSGMILAVKQMANLGITASQALLALFFIASIGFLVLSKYQRISLSFKGNPKVVFVPIISAIIVAFFSNLLNFSAIKLVSNPGYSTAVFNSSVVLTLVVSGLVFSKSAGGEISARKWSGVIVTIGGVLLVILG